jgi:uncharacterized protein YndB with AHSA1/START domain
MIWKSIFAVIIVLAILIFAAMQIRSTTHVEYTLNAPINKVWAYFSDASMLQKIWGPHGYNSPVLQQDFRNGGKFIWGMQPDGGGEIVYNAGIFTDIVDQKKIACDMYFADAQGNQLKEVPVPGNWPEIIRLSIEFRDDAGKTTVIVNQEGIPLIMKLFSAMGWKQQFEKLEKLLAN